MFYLENGRTVFYQWDVDQRLVVNHDDVTEVHFSNAETDVALICEVYEENGERYADVPNILLQRPLALIVHGCCGECVRASACFRIIARAKPDDYIYTETEVRNFETLQKQVNAVLDGLSPSFERTEAFVCCRPFKNYPLKVISRIEGNLIGDNGIDPVNPYLLTGWDKVELYHGGKNLLDVSLATADEDAPDTLNGAVIEGGMVDISQQMSLAALTIPMNVKRGVWYDVWCRMQVYDRKLPANSEGTIQLYLEPNATQWVGNEETMFEEGEMTLHARFILTEEDIKEQAAINIRMVTPFPAKLRLWPMAMISVDGVQKSATEFEPYRGGEYVAEFGQGVHKGSFNWQTGELTTEWEHRVLDGTEDWKEFKTAIPSRIYYYLILGAKNVYVNGNNGGVICSHWPQREILTTTENNGVHLHNSDTDGGQDRLIFRPDISAYDTPGKWKAYLADQVAKGWPVTVAYQRTEPKTVQLEPREIPALEGENLLYSTTGDTTVVGREDLTYAITRLEARVAALETAQSAEV